MADQANDYTFQFLNCRNISAPEDEANGRKVYSGHAPATAVLGRLQASRYPRSPQLWLSRLSRQEGWA